MKDLKHFHSSFTSSNQPQNLILSYYVGESKSNAFCFSIGIITDTGTCIIYQNEAGLLCITSLLLNIVTISLNSNVPPFNKSMNPYFIKLCWRFFEALPSFGFHFLVTGLMFTSETLFHGSEEMIVWRR